MIRSLARFALLASASLVASAAPVEFSRDIQPILSDNCYHCHGPDAQARKAKLRLDTRDGAFRLGKDGRAVIVPGHADQSELVRRASSADPDEQMPPPDSNRKLSPAQIETLRRWVEQGAAWGEHWAIVPPKRPPTPATARLGWARNGIDPFVLARLEQERLAPAPPADRPTLIRRVTFDLTGLPPTPREVDDFLADDQPGAYERVVDRLLASPRFGERMASDWLDLARYADTHGYQSDRYRAMWPYRDWVIAAFNDDLPFDQFLTWQLAGDLLPSPTKAQRLATAFNRLHNQNEEGGIVEEEFRVAYVVDRVNTMGTAFLGLTFECCRCHDHKFDPIAQREFYSLFAFFQNVDESGQTSYFTDAMPVPTLLLTTDAQDATLAGLRARIDEKTRQLAARRTAAHGAFDAWLATAPQVPAPKPVASYAFGELKANKVPNHGSATQPAQAHESPRLVPGPGESQAIELTGENGFIFPDVGHFSRADPFALALWLQVPAYAPRAVVLHHSKAPIDAGSRGYELLLEEGRVAFGLHHMWPGNSLKVLSRQQVPLNEWAHVAVSYDGSSRAAGVRIYLNGVALACDVVRDGLVKDIAYTGKQPDLALGYRFRDNGFKAGQVAELQVFDQALTPHEAEQLAHAGAPSSPTPPRSAVSQSSDDLFDYYLARVDPESRQLTTDLHALRTEQARTIEPIPEVMAMQELPRPKPAFILKRGAYDAPGDPVTADTPHALPPFPADQPRNRLGLARWLLQPDHPLTARVTVNRLWQQMFGRGIVETAENFGRQGAPPTHPELLDFLARTFVDDLHWDVKAMLRLIATSATYQQSSKASPDLLARDPANQLLARGPSRRLTAEMLRDQALADGGLLVEQLGGPSVKPYQPPGLWEIAMGRPTYDQGHGADLYRRSLYTFWKRTVPPPAMVAFDAADRSYCTARRQSTSTPLQALALLNDTQMVEAARRVGQRMMTEGGETADERLAFAFRLVTGRPPSARELPVLRQLYGEQRAIFAADPAEATKLLKVGESKANPSLDPIDLAASTVLAQALFNHDAAVMRR